MAKVFNRVMGILGLDDEDDIEEIQETEMMEESSKESEYEEPAVSSKRGSKVVNIHTASSVKVVISKPKTYEEATLICDDLKNRKIIVVNTSELDFKIAQRLLDFMGGASYVLGGELQEIEKGVYMLSPSNVEVSNELKNELTSKGIFNWK
ncbi:MAG: cell division protein SepF [Bacillota bacterium]|nr:cell division protein SepF [Bacillota bacterium]